MFDIFAHQRTSRSSTQLAKICVGKMTSLRSRQQHFFQPLEHRAWRSLASLIYRSLIFFCQLNKMVLGDAHSTWHWSFLRCRLDLSREHWTIATIPPRHLLMIAIERRIPMCGDTFLARLNRKNEGINSLGTVAACHDGDGWGLFWISLPFAAHQKFASLNSKYNVHSHGDDCQYIFP